jgi:hypothetical protein
MSNHLGTPLIG